MAEAISTTLGCRVSGAFLEKVAARAGRVDLGRVQVRLAAGDVAGALAVIEGGNDLGPGPANAPAQQGPKSPVGGASMLATEKEKIHA